LRIAIVGAGVAGSYLVRMLSGEHRVTAFEAQGEADYRSICAWGAPKAPMREFASRAGLSFDEYILHEGRYFTMRFGDRVLEIPLTGLSTFDKERFLADLRRGGDVRFGVRVPRGSPPGDYDLVVDATGFHRALVGRPSREFAIPTLEYMVRYREMPFDDFYAEVFPGLTGYLWFFPLSGNRAHVGSGDLSHRHAERLARFLGDHPPDEVLRRVGRPVRLASPSMSVPLRSGNVVAVGEAAGVVFPSTGEGIVPSLQSAEVLISSIRGGIARLVRGVDPLGLQAPRRGGGGLPGPAAQGPQGRPDGDQAPAPGSQVQVHERALRPAPRRAPARGGDAGGSRPAPGFGELT